MIERDNFDFVVIGGGPSGHKAAIQAAKAGASVLLVNRDAIGGECLHRGTIPSKTLRESAVYLSGLRRRSEGVLDIELPSSLKVESLMRRLRNVLAGQEHYLSDQLSRNGIAYRRGLARFVSEHELEVTQVGGKTTKVKADYVIVATGSHPRTPSDVPVDHENVLDSDSILSLIYLPRSMVVLGGGVIACEFASVFLTLGVEVSVVDHHPRPLGFLDSELTDHFVDAFEGAGGSFLLGRKTLSVAWDGISRVQVELKDGERVSAEKCLCALGRVAQTKGLGLDQIGVSLSTRGHIPVDEYCRTVVPNVYAVGDVIGPPALAATALEQGRRAARHALGLPHDERYGVVPIGIYAVPEMASVGLTEAQAIEQNGGALVGRALFSELARGLINSNTDGMLKLVTDPSGERVLGAHIIGEDATELVHVAQMGILAGMTADAFVENIFNFPTMAEAYRVAALDVIAQRNALRNAG